MNQKYSATYSPDDNKLRLYASERLDDETFAKVKSAGFKWAPKQQLFVAPMWTPGREDLLISLAGEIGDEDTSLIERAEERAERFENYSENRLEDAKAAQAAVAKISSGIPFGQPILIGHHSEKRARKDAEKIESGMKRAVKMWEQSTYWTSRAAGAVASAKYKELPAVRTRRIKKIEADRRRCATTVATAEKEMKLWAGVLAATDPERQRELATTIANFSKIGFSRSFPLADFPRDPPASQYEGPMSYWSAITGGVITGAQAANMAIRASEGLIARQARWIAHFDNRLAYERAMLDETGGIPTDAVKPEVGGAVKTWHSPGRGAGWSYIQKVNKVTVSVYDAPSYGDRLYFAKVPFDKIPAVMSKAQVEAARSAGRVSDVERNGKVYGFMLQDAEPVPAPRAPSPDPAPADGAEFEAMAETLKKGITIVTAPQLFPTPPDLAERVAGLADIQPGHDVLEPSAGTGNLIGVIGCRMFAHNPERGSITAVELNVKLAARLRTEYPLTRVVNGDFLEVAEEIGQFDRILMNPPFENGSDIKHIQKAAKLLKPGGRLVAICANGPRQNAVLKPLASEWEDLPPGAFKAQGTGVNAALLVIEN